MAYRKLAISPGTYKDDTPLSAEGFFSDINQGRFIRDKFETRKGMEYATATPFEGICRGMHSWADSNAIPYAGMGTHSNVYALNDGSLYDITPIISRGQTSISFTTTNGSAVVTADWTAHGLVEGQGFALRNSTVASVGGVTINTPAASSSDASPQYLVASVVTANQITFTAAQTASSGAGPTAATVDYVVFLAPGLVDSLGVGGYGTGGYGSGTYGTSSATTLYCRTWSLDNWSQNLLANPRGGGIYEWAPKLSQTELVTNGDFSSGTGWTAGAGWSIAAGIATATAGAGSDLSTTITMATATWFVLEFDYTRTAGTLQPYIGSTALGSSLSSASGHVVQVFYTNASSTLKFTKDAAFAGTVDNVSVKQLINLNIVTGAPTQNICMLVTPEFICMALGTVERVSGNFNPLCIRTSDQFANTANTGIPLQTWTPSTSNQSIETYLAKGGRIVGAMNGPGGVYVWTDSAMYVGRYVPDPFIVYRFDLVGEGCGLLGPNAACVVGSVAYWMSNNGQFYRYDGGIPTPIESTVRRDVYDNLAMVQGDKVYASAINAYGEAQWLYPDSRDGVECSRYVKLNPFANSVPAWDVGTFARSAWIDKAQLEYPLSAGTDGYIWYQEKGDAINGGNFSWRARTGAYQLGDGQNLWQCSGLILDFEDMQGGMSLTVRTYLYPASSPTVLGPYSITAASTKLDFIAVGRQIDFEFSGNTAPCFNRFGSLRINVSDTGMEF
jgi:hypothetical protein